MSSEDTVVTPVKAEKVKGPRGELGKGSAGKRLKALFAAHQKANKKSPLSLKAFAKTLKDNPDVKTWAANKAGKNNEKRTDANLNAARLAAQSTKAAKRKKKGEGGGAAK